MRGPLPSSTHMWRQTAYSASSAGRPQSSALQPWRYVYTPVTREAAANALQLTLFLMGSQRLFCVG